MASSDPWVTSGSTRQKLRREVAARRERCLICGRPIDYTLRYPNPASFVVAHVVPRSEAPQRALDPSNLKAAHLACNRINAPSAKVRDTSSPPGRPGDPDSLVGLSSEEAYRLGYTSRIW